MKFQFGKYSNYEDFKEDWIDEIIELDEELFEYLSLSILVDSKFNFAIREYLSYISISVKLGNFFIKLYKSLL